MAQTLFTDVVTLIPAAWLNDVDAGIYNTLSAVSGTNTIVGTGPTTVTAYAANQRFFFTPANTNTGATTLSISSIGAKNVFDNGAACVGGELRANIPVLVIYDGTQFNIIGRGFSNETEDLVPDKTADFTWSYDASAKLYKKVKMQQFPLPRGQIGGLGLTNNAGDATNDIDFAVGEARDSTNAANLIAATAMTKQLDAAWAAGTNAGGRMSAAAIANTTYHCFVIRKDTDGTCDFGFDTSPSAPTMPAGYTYFRRIGSILREAAAIVAFTQDGEYFRRTASVLDIDSNNPGTAAVTRTLSVPTGLNLQAILQLIAETSSTTFRMLVSDLAATDETPSSSNATVETVAGGTSGCAVGPVLVRTNTSAQVRSRQSASDAATTTRIRTLGWMDTRGRNT